jgi:uncharacterized membrane protein YuzA (DUF378 family)
MRTLNIITLALVVIGGINWGLVGFFDFNLVAAIFGPGSALTRLIYCLVGLSALWQIWPFIQATSIGEVPAERGYRV